MSLQGCMKKHLGLGILSVFVLFPLGSSADAQRDIIDLHQKIKSLESEMSNLRGDNEQLRYELERLKSLQRENMLSVDQQMQDLRQREQREVMVTPTVVAPTPVPVEPAPTPATIEPAPTPTVPSGAAGKEAVQSAYEGALELLRKGSSQEAIDAFSGFIKDFPKEELTTNAQYWLGEARYALRDYAGATHEFLRLLKTYKDSEKEPDAAVKLGFSYYELGHWEHARKVLESTVVKFPDSRAAQLAKERLDRMTTEGH